MPVAVLIGWQVDRRSEFDRGVFGGLVVLYLNVYARRLVTIA